jgi:hypothetical protein
VSASRWSFSFVALATLVVTSHALAVAQSATGMATVSGRVLEAGTNQPVRRAIVTLSGGALAIGRSAVTDDEGRFVIAQVPEGDFALSATRPGFLKAAFGASRPGRPGTPITIRGSAPRSDIAISMTHGSALAGVIRDASGDLAPGMRVEAIRILHLSAGDRAEKLGEARADDRGEFRIFGLPAGDYVLAATPARVVGGMGDIGAPSEAEIDAKLTALKTRSALPAPGASPPASAPAPTQEKGYSTPAVFYPGVITQAEAVFVTVGANESREGLDFAARLSHAATVDGNIVAVRGATVPPQLQLALQGSGPQLPVFGSSLSGPSVRADPATHTFRVTNVPPGHYRLIAKTLNAPGNNTQVMASGGGLPKINTSAGVLWGAVEFDATGEDMSGITLTVQPAPAVMGRFVIDGASKAPASLAGTRVALEPMPDSDRRSNGLSSPIVVATNAKGAFELPTVIPGAYRVTASLPSGWWLRSAMTNGADVLDGILTVDANGLSDLTLTMSDRRSSVGGTLTTAGGPATEFFLVAFTADKTLWRAPSRRVRSTRPATSGAFEVADLPPGQYFLAALKDLDAADLEDPAFLESLIPAAAAITIVEGQKTTQDLRIGG